MLTFHRNPNDTGSNNTIAVFREGDPVDGGQLDCLLLTLNRLGGLDPTDPLWDDVISGGDLRVAEMLESKTEPPDAADELRRLAAFIIRRLVAGVEQWQCEDCPYFNVGPICTKCGAPRPQV